MDYCLTTSNLTKRYRKCYALNGLTMHVPCGAIYGLIGKNGAGKTTLIRMICGLQHPTNGSYAIYGANHTDKEIYKARKRMGAVVETPSIYSFMTAEENLKQQYILLGKPSYGNIEALLDLVGLSNTGNKKVKNFSLGMRQRLGIALALAGDPDFIVLDEPVNGLDPQGIVEIRELIIKLNKERNITFMISSHILGELSKLATYYGFVDKGRIIKEISAAELEKACRRCLVIHVDSSERLAPALDSANVEYKLITDTEAEIYSEITITRLNKVLSDNGITLVKISEKDEDLESYYINLLGGKDNA